MGQKMIKKQEVELDLITLKATKIPYSFKEGDTNVHEITLKLDVEEGFEFEKARIHYSNGDYQDIEGLTFIIKNSALETGGRSFEVEFISGAAVRRSGKVEYRVDRSINSEYEAYDKYNELKKLYDAYTDAVDNEVEREQLKVELIELKNNVKSDLESVNSAAQDIADSENDRKQNEVIREQKKIELESLVTDIQSMLDSGAFVGDRGASIEYDWNGTQLGIRRENETAFNYVDLKGERGDTGDFSNLNAEHIETALGFTPVHPDGGITTKRKETVVEYWLDTPEVFTDIDISASDTFFVVIAANNVFVNFVNVNTELNINDTVRIIYDNYSGYDAYINHTVEVDGVYHYSPGNEYRLPSGTGVIDFNFMSLDFGGEITPIAIGTTSGGAGRELAESAENNRQSTFETNETKRQNEFEENEQGRESAESVRVSNEEERELNEAERITKDSERDSKIEEIQGNLESKANKQQEDWITPTLLNGWTNPAISVYPKAGYYKDELGIVHLRGFLTGGVSGAIFELPVGYRSGVWVVTTVATNWYGGTSTISIEDRWVKARPDTSGAFPSTVHLNNISFRAVG